MPNEQAYTNSSAKILIHPPEDLPYEVVSTYLNNCRKGLASLKEAIARLDYDYIGTYGHRMKGSGASYGFPTLTETGGSIEQAARARNDGDLLNGAALLEAHLESFEVVER